jgi:hypothetical protein
MEIASFILFHSVCVQVMLPLNPARSPCSDATQAGQPRRGTRENFGLKLCSSD